MLRSCHNFLFVSFDPGGLVTVDKPPLALWVQAASAKLFGFSPLSLLLPEAIAGVLAVALLYVITRQALRRARRARRRARARRVPLVRRRLPRQRRRPRADPADGRRLRHRRCARAKADAGARCSCCARARRPGVQHQDARRLPRRPRRSRSDTSLCAPGSLRRRLAQLLVAGAVMLVVSFAWIAFVELTPASQRPYVGSSTNNTELGLTFEYNGARAASKARPAAPAARPCEPGAYVPIAPAERIADAAAEAHARHAPPAGPGRAHTHARARLGRPWPVKGRAKEPIPFGDSPNPLRLFGAGLGDQAGWLLPFALFGLLAMALLVVLVRLTGRRRGRRAAAIGAEELTSPDGLAASPPERPESSASPRAARGACPGARGGRRRAAAPPADVQGLARPSRARARRSWCASAAGSSWRSSCSASPRGSSTPTTSQRSRPARARWRERARSRSSSSRAARCQANPGAPAGGVRARQHGRSREAVLMHREHYMVWFIPVLVVGCAVGLLALVALRRLAAPAVALMLALLLVAPAAYASTTWLAPVEGTFPVAGPKAVRRRRRLRRERTRPGDRPRAARLRRAPTTRARAGRC